MESTLTESKEYKKLTQLFPEIEFNRELAMEPELKEFL